MIAAVRRVEDFRTETAVEAGTSLGFQSLEDEIRVDALPVEGEFPEWLTGSLLRTGPSKFEVGDRSMAHWFDGLAMLHRFSFGDGEVSYASRFLESKAYRAANETGEITYSEFATDPCRSLFKRAMSLFQPSLSDNDNVNLVKFGERFVAMTETTIPIEFDPETLEAAGVAWEVPGTLTTAHPHLDRDSGAMLNYAVKFGRRSEYRFFSLDPDAGGDGAKVISATPTRQPSYMHSFGLTENWIVLVEYPLVVNPLALVFSGRPFIENFKWKPELRTRFTLIDRKTGEETGPFLADPCFAFHHVNAFEAAGEVLVDVCTFDDPQIVQSLYLENLRNGGFVPGAALTRFTISPATGSVASERLVEEPMDLPRINYGRVNARPYRYAWGLGSDGASFFDRIVLADVEQRTTRTWKEPGNYPGEPVFVPEPDNPDEAGGVILSIVLDATAETSYLAVFDAATLEEKARATVPHTIPFHFHGQYIR